MSVLPHALQTWFDMREVLSDDGGRRDREDEPAATRRVRRLLAHDLVLEVPGQDQEVVRPGLLDNRGGLDRQANAGDPAALLEGVAIDHVVQEVRTDAGIVE